MIPPDSHNRPTASPAEDRQGSDLTLNGPTSAADVDAVPELRLKPEVDSSSTLVPEHVPLERPDSVPPSAPAQPQRPHVAILFTDDADRSWLSRLLSLKAPWKKEHLGRSAYDEPVTMEVDKTPWEEHLRPSAHDEPVKLEVIGNFEKHLASPAALRDVGASIDQRLAPVEEVGGQRAGAAIDAAVHDLCSQTLDRLVRVEAAIQRTEGFVAEKPWDPSPIAHKLERVEETLRLTQTSLADSMVPELCVKIERQLGQVRMALQRTEEAVADTTLHELCRNIEARLELTEATLHRGEDLVAERLQELAARMTARFGEVEERLRLTQQSLADSTLPEVCDNIERQLIQTRTALQRSEEAVADKTLHELCQNIEARLERTEGTLRRNEGSVADWFQDFSAHMTARFATVEETIQRIERVVSGGIVEQQPSVPNGRSPRSSGGYCATGGRRCSGQRGPRSEPLREDQTDEPSYSAAVDGRTCCAGIGGGGSSRPDQDERRRGSGEGSAAHNHRPDFDSCGASSEPGDSPGVYNHGDGERPSVHPREAGFRAGAAVA